MPDDRFFHRAGPFSVGEIADLIGSELRGSRDMLIEDVASLGEAGARDITYCVSTRYLKEAKETRAGACILSSGLVEDFPNKDMALLLVEDPVGAYARVAEKFYPSESRPSFDIGVGQGDSYVHPDAELASGVTLEPGVVIGAGAQIGEGSCIGANSCIGRGVVLGRGCAIGAQVTITHALLGDKVYIWSGVRIGQDGFGYPFSHQGQLRVPQLGRVVIGDDVHIGANCTIERGSSRDTVIGAGSRLGALVQIGHNVRLGKRCILCAMVGISGSVDMGDDVVLGGQVGVADNLKIGSNSIFMAKSGVSSSLPGGEIYSSPSMKARPVREARRVDAVIALLGKSRPSRALFRFLKREGDVD